MNDESITLHRRELYNLVWSEPVSRLAKKYGCSDVWLAKICKRYNIPRPGRGYWARKQAGERVPTTPLPKKFDDPVIEIGIRHPRPGRDLPTKNSLTTASIPKTIRVPDSLTDPHPLVRKSAQILESSKPNQAGILVPSKGNCLDISISRECLDRTLRIMDTLIKSLSQVGFETYLKEGATVVGIHGVPVGISIHEETKRRHIKAAEHDLDGYYRFGFNLYADHAVPSGNLFLVINDQGFTYGTLTRKTWRDTEAKRLEDCLRSFIFGLIRAANAKNSLRQKKENSVQETEHSIENETGEDI